MSETIKFGPAWMRTGGGDNTHTMRYQLADLRYGREEMLALFDKAKQLVPHVLPRFKNLYIETIQNPLAMTPDTEDGVTVKQKHVLIFLRN